MHILRTFCFLVLFVHFASDSSRAALLLSYAFNDTGTTTAATGTTSNAGSPNLSLETGADAVDLHGSDGSGVSGLPGDRALDLSSANGMGGAANFSGGRAMSATNVDAIGGLSQFTISGWFKTAAGQPIGNNATLVNNQSNVLDGFALYGDPNHPGALTLAFNDSTVTSTNAFNLTQQWVNFAVTFDGSIGQPGPNVFFYMGTQTSPLIAVGSGLITPPSGTTGSDNAPLSIGGIAFTPTGANIFPFAGLLDDIRIYDSVVPLAVLDSQRMADTVAVPEPSGLLLGLFAVVFLAVAMKRGGTV